MKFKKIGLITLSTMIGLGTLASSTYAVTPNQLEQSEQLIKVSALEVSSTDKAKLIQEFKRLFPGQFDFLEDRDFNVDQFRYPELDQDINRVALHFHKQMESNKFIHGHLEFVGDNLQLQSFYTQPLDTKEAMYPPKVSQDEAKVIATNFVNRFKGSETFRIQEGPGPRYYWRNRTLTEPIEYQFYFEKIVNGVPVANQGVNVIVLGNGEITQFYGGQFFKDTPTYESISNTLNEEEMLETIKDMLGVELRYIIQHPYPSVNAKAELVYIPRPYFEGIHAKDGKWLVGQEFKEKAPENTPIEMLKSPSTAHPKPVTKEAVKAMAEKLLPKETSSGKLHIDGVYEETMGDIEVYSVQYTYRSSHGSTGTSFSVNKENGEVIHYYSMYDRYEKEPVIRLSYEEGLKKAISHLESFAPQSMSNYAYPRDYHYNMHQRGEYSYHFPLVKNGIVVDGAGLHVSLSAEDGSLISFNNHPINVEEWPATSQVVKAEQALEDFKDAIELNLTYQNIYGSKNESHFHLIYAPVFKERFARYDARLGEWTSENQDIAIDTIPKLSGHWAKEEIQYLINSKILTVEDYEKFNPNENVTKGMALEVLVKSIMYVDHYYYDQSDRQSFENIDKNHSLYAVIERAVDRGIIEKKSNTFNLNEPISRQELAQWYVRGLGLENIAKQHDIYKLSFADQNSIKPEFRGHVAISSALGIFEGNKNKQFEPNRNASIAELAVTNFRYAKQATQFNIEQY